MLKAQIIKPGYRNWYSEFVGEIIDVELLEDAAKRAGWSLTAEVLLRREQTMQTNLCVPLEQVNKLFASKGQRKRTPGTLWFVRKNHVKFFYTMKVVVVGDNIEQSFYPTQH